MLYQKMHRRRHHHHRSRLPSRSATPPSAVYSRATGPRHLTTTCQSTSMSSWLILGCMTSPVTLCNISARIFPRFFVRLHHQRDTLCCCFQLPRTLICGAYSPTTGSYSQLRARQNHLTPYLSKHRVAAARSSLLDYLASPSFALSRLRVTVIDGWSVTQGAKKYI